MTRHHTSVAAIALVLVVTATGCRGKSLAVQVDELLQKGQVAEANLKLSKGLPKLVRDRKLAQVDEVADVLETRMPALAPTDAQRLRQNGLARYFEGIDPDLPDLPYDDLCELAVTGAPQPSLSRGASLDELMAWIEENRQRRNLAEWCKLLGINF